MTDKGQTNIDFLIGMSVFLLSVAFVFGLVPNVFEPFTADSGENSLVADRAAATLVEDLLGSPDAPTHLNVTCTSAFFDGTAPAECPFDATDLNDVLAIPDTAAVNVTIEDDGTIKTVSGTRLATGKAPPTRSSSVIVSHRVVLIDGETSRLNVRVW